MKKKFVVILCLFSVCFLSIDSDAGWKDKFKKNKNKTLIKMGFKKNKKKKKITSVPVPGKVVLVKGLQISWFGKNIKDNGSITISSLGKIKIPVLKGKFDLTLPSNPVFSTDRRKLDQQLDGYELDFGSAKVYPVRVVYFQNSKGNNRKVASGRGFISLKLFYSDRDAKGTVNESNVELKKGWNIIGDKTSLIVRLMSVG